MASERRKREMNTIELLTERVHLFELVNDASIDGIVVCDTNLAVVYWNKTIENFTGITRDEAVGKNYYALLPAHSGNETIAQSLHAALNGMKAFVPYEKVAIPAAYHEYHFVPLLADDARVQGVLAIVHDIAHRVKAENELKALNKSLVRKNRELKARNAELSSFSQLAAQDINEPLHKMYTFVEMVIGKEGEHLSDNVRAYLKRIQGSAQRMRLLTDRLRDYYEISNLKPQLEFVNLDEVAIIAARRCGRELSSGDWLQIPAPLPAVKCDRAAMEQLFQNLLSNAIRFQPKDNTPRVTITATTVKGRDTGHHEANKNADYIRLDFADNGIGFEQHGYEAIFQLFHRLSSTYPGSGIGLAICKKITDLHNCFLSATSTPGQGSTFHVFLPVHKS